MSERRLSEPYPTCRVCGAVAWADVVVSVSGRVEIAGACERCADALETVIRAELDRLSVAGVVSR